MIAILYPLKMDKNLSEAYSTIYESSLTSGSSGGNYHDVGGGDYRSTDQVVRMNNDPKGTKKYGSKMMKKVGNTMNDLKIPTVRKKNESLEPEGEIVEGKKDLPKTKMYRKAGNLSRKALSQGLDSEEGSKAQKRSEKIVSTISTADEKKRFDNMKTKKSELYNDTTGKFRQEWEALKLIETENHREKFDTWLEGIAEEGYDIDRWTDEELVDTFINENDLWDSREAVETALFESDKKGSGSGKKDACYKKVKASASVWPSAYASGRLVQCRKKGAANYGKSSKKEEVEYEEVEYIAEIPGSGTVAKEVGKQVFKRGIKRAAKRAAIKIGKKTGGKVVQAATKQGGKELKKQVVAASGEIAASTVKKTGEKLRQKAAPDTNKVGVEEAVATPPKKKAGTAEKVGGIVGSIGGGAAGTAAAGAAGSVVPGAGTVAGGVAGGVAGSLAGEQVGKKIGRAIDKKMKPKTKINSSFSDWRGELNLDENRATAYTAGMSDGQKAAEMNKISPKVADQAGRSHDKFMFGKRKKGGDFNKKYNKEVLKDKKYNQNTTGRGTPPSYRKGYEDQDMGRYQSKIRQGKGSIKDLGKKK